MAKYTVRWVNPKACQRGKGGFVEQYPVVFHSSHRVFSANYLAPCTFPLNHLNERVLKSVRYGCRQVQDTFILHYIINKNKLLQSADAGKTVVSYRNTMCFKAWNRVFHMLKQSVSHHETKCFKHLNSLFQAIETNWNYWQAETSIYENYKKTRLLQECKIYWSCTYLQPYLALHKTLLFK